MKFLKKGEIEGKGKKLKLVDEGREAEHARMMEIERSRFGMFCMGSFSEKAEEASQSKPPPAK